MSSSKDAHVGSTVSYVDRTYDRLQERFASRATLSLAYRLYNLKQLAYLIKDNEDAIHAAVKQDIDQDGFVVSLIDLYPVLNEIDLAVRRLSSWMKDETRWRDSMLAFKSMNPRIKKQPKGVCLLISPWNFPWQLTLSPLVGAIAAGCPVVIKPSELSPSSSALMARLIPQYLDSESYAVVLGGPEQSTHLLSKPWDHIMFTGSERVGKIVATAAAKTLTPTTLELGGKSPVIVSSCADVKKTARRLLTIKQLVNGQMCVSPDYVLCAKDRVEDFVNACKTTLGEFFPPSPHPESLLHSGMNACQRSDKDFDRQTAFIETAESKGKLVYRGEADPKRKRMGFSVVAINENAQGEEGGLVSEEIFGPVLPIIPVSTLEHAIDYINARPRPLALYVCSTKRSVFKRVVNETTSGSATWNEFAFATFARSLPFGGVGASGWGCYHGYDGFRTFSHFKSTLEVPLFFEPLMALRYPPVTAFARTVLTSLLSSGVPFSRPSSVEDEAKKLWWKKWRLMIGAVIIVIALGGRVGRDMLVRR